MTALTDNDNGFFKLSVLAFSFAVLAGLAASATFGDASLEPADPMPGDSVSNQKVVFDVNNLSADGDTDTFYIHFPEALEGNISVNQASIENVSISSSAELVDGVDNDSIEETVTFSVSPSDSDNVDTTAYVDASVTYPNESMELVFSGTVEDSVTGTSEATLVETYLGERETTDSEDDTTTEDEETSDSDNESTTDDSTTDSDDETTDTEESTDNTNTTEDDQTETDESTTDQETNQTETQDSNSSEQDNETYTPDQGQNETEDQTDEETEDTGIVESIVEFFTGLL
jgi:hypothetical protein